jgi:carboxylesterase type B
LPRLLVDLFPSARFETPKPPGLLQGVQNATSFGPACPQQKLTVLPIPFVASTYPLISEDCKSSCPLSNCSDFQAYKGLTLDIFKPSGAESTSKLPVFVVRVLVELLSGSFITIMPY